MGNVKGIPPGDVQRMSAGTGVQHSEFNHRAQRDHAFPADLDRAQCEGITPGYEQKTFADAAQAGRAAPGGVTRRRAGLGHDPCRCPPVCRAVRWPGRLPRWRWTAGRKGYVHLVRGALTVNGMALHTGDAALLADEPRVALADAQDAEVLVFDLCA